MDIREVPKSAVNGWFMVGVILLLGLTVLWALYEAVQDRVGVSPYWVVGAGATVVLIFLCTGFFMLQPNMAGVLTLFGRYKGTVRQTGLLWANPFLAKHKLSVRTRNFASDKIKVNDLRGNPIEIGCIIVWRIEDTAQAMFQVEAFEHYVTVQSEAALRHIAMAHPYDVFDGDTTSLRGSTDEVSQGLLKEVQERVLKAGVVIEEARLSHLAYAPEIAEAMLQRQQADAIVAARSRIVEGAVGMVEMALEKLEGHDTIHLDEERKAAMVSNLMVVLCGHEAARPVINAGSLYT
jgi:regulator of protease activity HflC (stomatin/prohibitin superfamily)